MNVQEAQAIAHQGRKVRHKFFTDDEYVYYDSKGRLMDETGTILTQLFWDVRQKGHWFDGWEEVNKS